MQTRKTGTVFAPHHPGVFVQTQSELLACARAGTQYVQSVMSHDFNLV